MKLPFLTLLRRNFKILLVVRCDNYLTDTTLAASLQSQTTLCCYSSLENTHVALRFQSAISHNTLLCKNLTSVEGDTIYTFLRFLNIVHLPLFSI